MDIKIGKIHGQQHYFDIALKRGKRNFKAFSIKNKQLDTSRKYQLLEKERISAIKTSLAGDLHRMGTAFPHIENLSPFSQNLFACIVDPDEYKQALGAVAHARDITIKLTADTIQGISRCKKATDIVKYQKAYMGRIASVLKKLNKPLEILEKARYDLLDFPVIDEEKITICIAGFPNVGKSTLLGKITTSHPEINSYAFTTKGLMVGYLRGTDEKVQVLDTPGTLNRLEKMNKIERMAHLALEQKADIIVYVMDVSEPYPFEAQKMLLTNLKKLNKPMVIYFSKADVIKDQIDKERANNKYEDSWDDSEDLLAILKTKIIVIAEEKAIQKEEEMKQRAEEASKEEEKRISEKTSTDDEEDLDAEFVDDDEEDVQ